MPCDFKGNKFNGKIVVTGIYNQVSGFSFSLADNTNCSIPEQQPAPTDFADKGGGKRKCIHLCNLPSATIYFYATVVTL
jgi:hypothetical protein